MEIWGVKNSVWDSRAQQRPSLVIWADILKNGMRETVEKLLRAI